MHPQWVILIYINAVDHRPSSVTVAYTEEEVAAIEKEWNDGYHHTEKMEIDYTIRGE